MGNLQGALVYHSKQLDGNGCALFQKYCWNIEGHLSACTQWAFSIGFAEARSAIGQLLCSSLAQMQSCSRAVLVHIQADVAAWEAKARCVYASLVA